MTKDGKLIRVFDSTDLAGVRALVDQLSEGRTFNLPEADLHIVGVSSGVDSTAVALVIAALFPELEIAYIFTDTGAEVEGTHQQLDKIEKLTGKSILRIAGKNDLFEIIESQGNFLPSQRQRYCTRMTKIMPLQAHFAKLKQVHGKDLSIASYVGIRADEPSRKGGVFNDGVKSYFPLQSLGLDRQSVYTLVDRWVGIPAYYMDKSRSGCEICIFSRRSEVIARVQKDSELVVRASKMEPLAEDDRAKLLDVPVSVSESIIGCTN